MVLSMCLKDLLNERLFIGTGANAVCKLYVTKNLEKIEFGLIFQLKMV